MKPRQYILDEQDRPKAEPDLLKWARWIEAAYLYVGSETIGNSTISTVFLGLDYNFGTGEPLLWETMVFGGELDQEQDRCSGLRKQAEAMHNRMVKRVKRANQKQV